MYAMNNYVTNYYIGNTPPMYKKNSNKEHSLKDV
jgi:hypothetical protein